MKELLVHSTAPVSAAPTMTRPQPTCEAGKQETPRWGGHTSHWMCTGCTGLQCRHDTCRQVRGMGGRLVHQQQSCSLAQRLSRLHGTASTPSHRSSTNEWMAHTQTRQVHSTVQNHTTRVAHVADVPWNGGFNVNSSNSSMPKDHTSACWLYGWMASERHRNTSGAIQGPLPTHTRGSSTWDRQSLLFAVTAATASAAFKSPSLTLHVLGCSSKWGSKNARCAATWLLVLGSFTITFADLMSRCITPHRCMCAMA